MKRSLALSLAFAAFAAAPFAPAQADGDAVARAVMGSAAEARGDFDAWLSELASAAARDPSSPFAMAAFAKIRALMGTAADPSAVEKALEPVLSRGVADGDIDETLRDILADRARARGEFDRAEKIGQNRGYLRRFAVTGPFGWSESALVHRKYPPEKRDLDLAAPMDGVWGPVRWIPVPVLGDNAWVSPREQLRRGTGVVYGIARVKSATARTVAMKAYCSDSFAVFVDGAVTILADRERDQVPDAVWATARLEAGWNRILVKVAGEASFALKLADPATGLPVLDLEEGDPLAGAEMPALTGDAEPRSYRTPAERALAAAGGDAAGLAAAAGIALDEGLRWDAHDAYVKAAAASDGGDATLAANVRAAFGRFLANFQEFTGVERKLRAKAEFEKALATVPLHNSAKVRLADYMNEDDHPDKAVKALQEQIKAQPTPQAWMAMARIAKQRGWEREAIDAANRASSLAPNSVEAIQFLQEFDRKYGNAAAAGKRTQRLLAINANDGDASASAIQELRAQGKHEEALALARKYAARWPGSFGWRANAASLLQALGRDDEALAEWRALAALVPLEESYPRTIAQILEGKGDTAGATLNYRKSLALEPFQPQVWRALARLEGKDADFAAAFEPDVNELIAKLPSTEELKKANPKAVAITVLDHDVVLVREDGSAQNCVHMVWKLLDENAVKKYGDVQNSGELLEIRAILPDGRVMTPTGLPGRAYNMEGLVPGTIIEHRFVAAQRPSPKGFDGGQFLFQDTDFGDEPNPVMLSRMVVISPASMKLDPVKRNYDGDPKVETKDGMTVTIWEKRDMPRIEPERYMPDAQEIVPLVDYSLAPDFDDVNWQLLGRRTNSRPTPLLAETVAKTVQSGMSDLEKLRALYEFVNDHVTNDYGGGGEGPTSTLMSKAGDRGQLFEALVRIAGVPYRHGFAMPWNGEGRSGPQRLDAAAFPAPFLLLEPQGAAPVPFVMLSRLAPFGLVPDSMRGSVAYVAGESGGAIRRLPAGGIDTQSTAMFEITLSPDPKAVKITGSVVSRGAGDYDRKRSIMEATEDDRKKNAERTFNRYFASPSLESVTFPALETRGAPFEMKLSGTMSNYVQPQGDSFVVALGLPKTAMSQTYVERAERVYDLVLSPRDDRIEEFTIDLAGAYAVTSLPEDHVVFHRLGTYSLTWREAGGKITVRRELHLHPARYRADEYKAFVAWCKAIDDAEERKLELRKIK